MIVRPAASAPFEQPVAHQETIGIGVVVHQIVWIGSNSPTPFGDAREIGVMRRHEAERPTVDIFGFQVTAAIARAEPNTASIGAGEINSGYVPTDRFDGQLIASRGAEKPKILRV